MVTLKKSSTSIKQQEEEEGEGRKQKFVASYQKNGNPMREHKCIEDRRQ
jgi:hypothetical protein